MKCIATGRRGFTVLETLAALAILAVAMVLAAQVGVWSLMERSRSATRYEVLEAANNTLEAARVRSWTELTPDWAAEQRLPQTLAERLHKGQPARLGRAGSVAAGLQTRNAGNSLDTRSRHAGAARAPGRCIWRPLSHGDGRKTMTARAITTGDFHSGRRPGFTLLEILVIMFALGVVMLLGTATLLGTIQMAQATTAGFDQLLGRSVLADQFRADVAQAADAPANVDEVTAGSTCLILRRADGRHIIYRWSNHELERSELSVSGTTRRRLPLGSAGAAVEFTRAGNDRRLVILRLSQSWGPGKRQRQLDIAAALGGDLR